jgi:hypothetical protein
VQIYHTFKIQKLRVLALLVLNITFIFFAIYTTLFLFFTSLLIFINLFSLLKIKELDNTLIKQLLITIILFFILSTLINVYFYIDSYKSNNVNTKAELNPSSHMLLREYSKSFPEGFKLKNQTIRYNLKIHSKNMQAVNVYDVTYIIRDRQRVSDSHNQTNISCPKFILIGDSHNFGQALNFDMTLQGNLSKIGKTTNLAVPGYGLNNSISTLIDFENSPEIMSCKGNFSNTKIIYRMIDDHINRNSGKTSFNPYGPKYDLNRDSMHAFCENPSSCLGYMWNYFRASLINRFLSSNEVLTRNLGSILYKYVFYQESDYDYSVSLVEKLVSLTNKLYPKSRLVIFIEDTDYNPQNNQFQRNASLKSFFNNSKVIKLIDKNFIVKMSDIINKNNLLPEECKKEESLYIKFEGHPNYCNNMILFDYLKNSTP